MTVDYGTFSSSQPAANAFDGNVNGSPAAGTENGSAITFTTNAFAAAGSYEVAVIADSSHVVTVGGAATVKDSGTGNIAHRATVGAFTEIKIQSVTSILFFDNNLSSPLHLNREHQVFHTILGMSQRPRAFSNFQIFF